MGLLMEPKDHTFIRLLPRGSKLSGVRPRVEYVESEMDYSLSQEGRPTSRLAKGLLLPKQGDVFEMTRVAMRMRSKLYGFSHNASLSDYITGKAIRYALLYGHRPQRYCEGTDWSLATPISQAIEA